MKIEITDQFRADVKKVFREDLGLSEEAFSDKDIESAIQHMVKHTEEAIENKSNKEETTK